MCDIIIAYPLGYYNKIVLNSLIITSQNNKKKKKINYFKALIVVINVLCRSLKKYNEMNCWGKQALTVTNFTTFYESVFIDHNTDHYIILAIIIT